VSGCFACLSLFLSFRFVHGDIVWAQTDPHFPFWPAIVISFDRLPLDIQNNLSSMKPQRSGGTPKRKQKIPVYFYGRNDYDFVAVDGLRDFEINLLQYKSQAVDLALQPAFLIGLSLAEEEITRPIEQRISWLSPVLPDSLSPTMMMMTNRETKGTIREEEVEIEEVEPIEEVEIAQDLSFLKSKSRSKSQYEMLADSSTPFSKEEPEIVSPGFEMVHSYEDEEGKQDMHHHQQQQHQQGAQDLFKSSSSTAAAADPLFGNVLPTSVNDPFTSASFGSKEMAKPLPSDSLFPPSAHQADAFVQLSPTPAETTGNSTFESDNLKSSSSDLFPTSTPTDNNSTAVFNLPRPSAIPTFKKSKTSPKKPVVITPTNIASKSFDYPATASFNSTSAPVAARGLFDDIPLASSSSDAGPFGSNPSAPPPSAIPTKVVPKLVSSSSTGLFDGVPLSSNSFDKEASSSSAAPRASSKVIPRTNSASLTSSGESLFDNIPVSNDPFGSVSSIAPPLSTFPSAPPVTNSFMTPAPAASAVAVDIFSSAPPVNHHQQLQPPQQHQSTIPPPKKATPVIQASAADLFSSATGVPLTDVSNSHSDPFSSSVLPPPQQPSQLSSISSEHMKHKTVPVTTQGDPFSSSSTSASLSIETSANITKTTNQSTSSLGPVKIPGGKVFKGKAALVSGVSPFDSGPSSAGTGGNSLFPEPAGGSKDPFSSVPSNVFASSPAVSSSTKKNVMAVDLFTSPASSAAPPATFSSKSSDKTADSFFLSQPPPSSSSSTVSSRKGVAPSAADIFSSAPPVVPSNSFDPSFPPTAPGVKIPLPSATAAFSISSPVPGGVTSLDDVGSPGGARSPAPVASSSGKFTKSKSSKSSHLSAAALLAAATGAPLVTPHGVVPTTSSAVSSISSPPVPVPSAIREQRAPLVKPETLVSLVTIMPEVSEAPEVIPALSSSDGKDALPKTFLPSTSSGRANIGATYRGRYIKPPSTIFTMGFSGKCCMMVPDINICPPTYISVSQYTDDRKLR
jgi:hypothetical protein